jgi:hypothetical protein
VIARAQPGLCHHKDMRRQGVLAMGQRESSTRVLQARRGVRGGASRMLGQGLANTERDLGSVLRILLEAAGYSDLLLAQAPLEGVGSRVARLQHPEVQNQSE